VLYVGQDNLVITGRSMDWMVPTGSNIWALPAGLTRDGAAARNSFSWTSAHGSVVSTMYDGVTVDGVNDAGLGAHALYLSAAEYPKRDPAVPGLSVAAWTQYALDMFSSVAEAVEGLTNPTFGLVSPVLPGGHAATGHLALSDSTGDSAIFEYLAGELVVHHGAEFAVMTNDPTYDQQVALCAYWDQVGGNAMLPGTGATGGPLRAVSLLPQRFDVQRGCHPRVGRGLRHRPQRLGAHDPIDSREAQCGADPLAYGH
jgi:choloylglycine hydrolase